MDKYEKMTQDDFDGILCGILDDMNGCQILSIPGAYEVFSEYFNNDVLDIWETENQKDD